MTYSRWRRFRATLQILVVLSCLEAVHTSRLFDAYGQEGACKDGDSYLCGCHAVPKDQMSAIQQTLGQSLECQRFCHQRSCQQSCEQSVCLSAMGSSGEYCTTTAIPEAMVIYIKTADCVYNDEMMVYQCKKGNSVAYPNEQTYTAIMNGHCIPSCNLDFSRFRCQFPSWFREETVFDNDDLEKGPYEVIRGSDYENPGLPRSEPNVTSDDLLAEAFLSTDVPEEEREPVYQHELEKERSKEIVPVIKQSAEEEEEEDVKSPASIAPDSKSEEPGTSESEKESLSASPGIASETHPSDGPESKDRPVAEPKSEEEPPRSEPQEDETPATEPTIENPPVIEVEPDEEPASEPEIEETPLSEPQTEEAPASEPEIEEPPMSEVEPDDEPILEPEIEEPPLSEVEPDDEPILEPEIEEPPMSEVEPDDEPILEPEIEEPPLSEPRPIEDPELAPVPQPSEKKGSRSLAPPEPEDTGNYTLYKSPFSECSQTCRQAGQGYKERSIICRDPVGVHVPLGMCDLPENLNQKYVQRCESQECGPDYYFVLSSWSECPKRCATVSKNGTVIPNEITREIECRRTSDNTIVDASFCEDLIQQFRVILKTPCHSVPCTRYGYSTSEWGICNCQSWKQQRKVVCKHWSKEEDKDVDASFCRNFNLTEPTEERSCYPSACFEIGSTRKLLETGLDRCKFTNCSTKGDCSKGRCRCTAGFDGPDCQIQEGDNACPKPSLLNSEGGCCTSGIFDFDGVCCDSLNSQTDIDIDGKCCDQLIDACGKCNGERSVYDVAGQCCPVMDASGTCCWSGVVDECGICDGRGNTCNTTIGFDIKVDDDQDELSCVDRLRNLVQDALNITRVPLSTDSRSAPRIAFSRRNVSLTTGAIWFRIYEQVRFRDLSQKCHVEEIFAKKVPVCGNGYCEVDEPHRCPQDCDFSIQTCPTQKGLRDTTVMCNGHGLCSFRKSFKCNCFVGYEGQNCESCSPGFFRVEDDRRCIPSQAFLNRPDVDETEKTPVATASVHPLSAVGFRSAHDTRVARNNADGQVHYWPTVAAICVLFMLVSLIVIFAVIRRRRKRQEEDHPKEQESHNEEPASPVAPVRDYDAMWQSFNRDVAPSVPVGRRNRGRRSRGPSMDAVRR